MRTKTVVSAKTGKSSVVPFTAEEEAAADAAEIVAESEQLERDAARARKNIPNEGTTVAALRRELTALKATLRDQKIID